MDLEAGTLDSLKEVVEKNCTQGINEQGLTSAGKVGNAPSRLKVFIRLKEKMRSLMITFFLQIKAALKWYPHLSTFIL